jgi:hypothetical protein
MIYWAGLGSLALLWFWKKWPARIVFAEAILAALMILSTVTFPGVWTTAAAHSDDLRAACRTTMGLHFDPHAAAKLYENVRVVEQARPFLQKVWRKEQGLHEYGGMSSGTQASACSTKRPHLKNTRHVATINACVTIGARTLPVRA